MSHVTDCLTVYQTRHTKVRIGRDLDGGYVLAIGVTRYDAFLSGGICDENSFELTALDIMPWLECHAYDPTSGPGAPHERYVFHRDPVPLTLGGARNALVKLDVEGDEWPWLANASLWSVAQLVVELHSPHLDRWDWTALDSLSKSHYLIHAHGNNWDGIVNIDGVRVPGTLETTWLRRDLDPGIEPSTEWIPSALDRPNRPDMPDHIINWKPFVSTGG